MFFDETHEHKPVGMVGKYHFCPSLTCVKKMAAKGKEAMAKIAWMGPVEDTPCPSVGFPGEPLLKMISRSSAKLSNGGTLPAVDCEMPTVDFPVPETPSGAKLFSAALGAVFKVLTTGTKNVQTAAFPEPNAEGKGEYTHNDELKKYGTLMGAYIMAGYHYPNGAQGMALGRGGRKGEQEPTNFSVRGCPYGVRMQVVACVVLACRSSHVVFVVSNTHTPSHPAPALASYSSTVYAYI